MHEVFEHTADLGLRIRAAELDQVLEEAARAMFSVIVANLDEVRPVQSVAFRLSADCLENLLRDWLGELLYTFDTRRLLFSQFSVHVHDLALEATARGEPIDPARHRLGMEIKAVTYHALRLDRVEDGWLAEVIVDI
jgi:SHS2 domain-containing protein